jgi:hypothetical protein
MVSQRILFRDARSGTEVWPKPPRCLPCCSFLPERMVRLDLSRRVGAVVTMHQRSRPPQRPEPQQRDGAGPKEQVRLDLSYLDRSSILQLHQHAGNGAVAGLVVQRQPNPPPGTLDTKHPENFLPTRAGWRPLAPCRRSRRTTRCPLKRVHLIKKRVHMLSRQSLNDLLSVKVQWFVCSHYSMHFRTSGAVATDWRSRSRRPGGWRSRSTSWPWRSDSVKSGASACREATERNSANLKSTSGRKPPGAAPHHDWPGNPIAPSVAKDARVPAYAAWIPEAAFESGGGAGSPEHQRAGGRPRAVSIPAHCRTRSSTTTGIRRSVLRW